MRSDRPRLGCGRDLDEFWSTIDEAPTAHERICPDCQSARNTLFHLAAVTTSVRAGARPRLELQNEGTLKGTVMTLVRAEARRGTKTPLKTTHLGTIDVSEQALLALIRSAASTLPGVRDLRCTVTPKQVNGEEQQDTRDVHIKLEVALSSTVKIPETLVLVRERVGAVVEAQTSVILRHIDIVVADLYDL